MFVKSVASLLWSWNRYSSPVFFFITPPGVQGSLGPFSRTNVNIITAGIAPHWVKQSHENHSWPAQIPWRHGSKKQRLWFCIFRHSAVKSVWICVRTKNPRKYKRTLWLFNIDMENGPFIDGLPSYKMVIFHGYVSHNQMVYEHTMAHIPSPSPVWPSTQGPSTHPSTQILRRCHGFQNAICESFSNGRELPATLGTLEPLIYH